MKSVNENINRRSERGSASFLAILGLAAWAGLYKYGKVYFEGMNPALFWGSLLVTGVVALFLVGYAIHMRMIGAKSNRAIVEELQNKTKELRYLIRTSVETVNILESKQLDHGYHLSPRGIECLSTARKILMALEARYNEIRRLIASRSYVKLIEAYDMLHQPLIVTQSSLDSLIDSDPIPPINHRDWGFTLDRLFRQLETEVNSIDDRLQASNW
jgi:hypothetical protein